jgi:hypothetical protein
LNFDSIPTLVSKLFVSEQSFLKNCLPSKY